MASCLPPRAALALLLGVLALGIAMALGYRSLQGALRGR